MRARVVVALVAVAAFVLVALVWLSPALDTAPTWEPPPDSGVIRTVPVDTTHAEPRRRRGPIVGLEEIAIEIARRDPATVYASAYERGFFRSDDGGRTWRRYAPPGRYGTAAIAIDPADARVVYAGTDTIHKSVDGGASWRRADYGFTSAHVYAIAVEPGDGDRVYAFGDGGERPEDPTQGFFASDDGADTWTATRDHPYIHVIAVAGERIYAGGDGLHRSDDRGRTWAATMRGLPIRLSHYPDVRALAVAPTESRTIYAGSTDRGVYVSRDGGDTWLSTGLSPLGVFSVTVDARDPRLVYATTAADERSPLPSGMYVSDDGGRSWRAASRGLVGALSVAAHPREPRVALAVATDAAVYRTADAGRTWKRLARLPLGPRVG